MSDLLTERELAHETLKKPAKAWRNKWRAILERFTDDTEADLVVEGEEYWSDPIYPTREDAEADAFQAMWEDIAGSGELYDEFLGAFPIED